VLASPVIDEAGVLGQVTRVYPLSSEVTLLTDKDAAIPVLNTRTQARSAAFGSAGATGGMELRFIAANADVKVGDTLTTSGLDGVYPPGLPVATVVRVDRKLDTGFARVELAPGAQTDGVRHVLVIEPVGMQMPPRPEAAAVPDAAKASAPRRGGRTPSAASGAAP
jgi:rod shape-determining protein MreC